MYLSIIIPIYNEEGNIHLIHDRLTKVCNSISADHELIFVNDGSRDKSIDIIAELSTKHKEVKYINFSRNFGHQAAVSAGLDHAAGEYVCIIDADLQDPPELILDMHQKALEGYHVVYAKRRTRKGESAFKLFTAKYFYRTLDSITSIKIPLDTGDFRIMHKSVVNVVKNMPEKNKFLRGQIAWAGFKQTFVEYDRDQRFSGETGYPLKKMMKFAMDGVTSFSALPLKLATWLGFIVALISFVLIIYALYSKYVLNDYQSGWASIIISVLFIGGIQLICIGIIGEYISRIFDNVRDRPTYIVQDKNF
jgi:polyisoprenyl-phosphate glycosyltransferase